MTKVIEKLNKLSKEELDSKCEEIKKKNWINKGLTPNATPSEKVKYNICQNILRYKRENNLSELELAKKLGIKNQEQLEHLLFCRIEQFFFNELTTYWELIFGTKVIQKSNWTLYNELSPKSHIWTN